MVVLSERNSISCEFPIFAYVVSICPKQNIDNYSYVLCLNIVLASFLKYIERNNNF
jgi:hypothetical protein